MCQKCKGLFACNVHMCPQGSLEQPVPAPSPRPAPQTVRRVIPSRVRPSSMSTRVLLDSDGKQ